MLLWCFCFILFVRHLSLSSYQIETTEPTKIAAKETTNTTAIQPLRRLHPWDSRQEPRNSFRVVQVIYIDTAETTTTDDKTTKTTTPSDSSSSLPSESSLTYYSITSGHCPVGHRLSGQEECDAAVATLINPTLTNRPLPYDQQQMPPHMVTPGCHYSMNEGLYLFTDYDSWNNTCNNNWSCICKASGVSYAQWATLPTIGHAKQQYLNQNNPNTKIELTLVCALLESDQEIFAKIDSLSKICDEVVVLKRSTATLYGGKPNKFSLETFGTANQEIMLARNVTRNDTTIQQEQHASVTVQDYFSKHQPLPFVQDLLDAARRVAKRKYNYTSDNHDNDYYVLLSNTNVLFAEHFYPFLHHHLQEERKAYQINRLNTPQVVVKQALTSVSTNSETSTTNVDDPLRIVPLLKEIHNHARYLGKPHRGSDTFVIHSSIVKKIHLGEQFMGVPAWSSSLKIILKDILAKGNFKTIESHPMGTLYLEGIDNNDHEKLWAGGSIHYPMTNTTRLINDRFQDHLLDCPVRLDKYLPTANPEVLLINHMNCGKAFRKHYVEFLEEVDRRICEYGWGNNGFFAWKQPVNETLIHAGCDAHRMGLGPYPWNTTGVCELDHPPRFRMGKPRRKVIKELLQIDGNFYEDYYPDYPPDLNITNITMAPIAYYLSVMQDRMDRAQKNGRPYLMHLAMDTVLRQLRNHYKEYAIEAELKRWNARPFDIQHWGAFKNFWRAAVKQERLPRKNSTAITEQGSKNNTEMEEDEWATLDAAIREAEATARLMAEAAARAEAEAKEAIATAAEAKIDLEERSERSAHCNTTKCPLNQPIQLDAVLKEARLKEDNAQKLKQDAEEKKIEAKASMANLRKLLRTREEGDGGHGKVCAPLRNVSNYTFPKPTQPSRSVLFQKPYNEGTQESRYENCLRFTCDWENHTRCNNWEPTNLDGPKPPCCVHILRDMAKAFDNAMCELGFEYFVSYGMLLGLVRDDKLIPWTMDNDYIATEQTLAAMMALTEEEKFVFDKYGIDFLYDNFFRVCLTHDFMDGKLAENWIDTNETRLQGWYPLIYPYADIFIAREEASGSYMVDELDCAHPMHTFRPLRRTPVYNNSFSLSLPNRPEEAISVVYGPNWRIPDSKKSPHGDTRCAKNQFSKLKTKHSTTAKEVSSMTWLIQHFWQQNIHKLLPSSSSSSSSRTSSTFSSATIVLVWIILTFLSFVVIWVMLKALVINGWI